MHEALSYNSSLFSDVLDSLGFRNQVIAGLQLNNQKHRCFGRARTLRLETYETDDERIALGLGFLDTLKQGEIFLVEGSDEFAYFGELMTRLSLRMGIGGVVIGGLTRDTPFTRTSKLPIFAEGYSPKDIKKRGRVKDVDVSIKIRRVDITPGDYVFGDSDGVVVIPAMQLKETLALCRQKQAEEGKTVKLIDSGVGVKELLRHVREF